MNMKNKKKPTRSGNKGFNAINKARNTIAKTYTISDIIDPGISYSNIYNNKNHSTKKYDIIWESLPNSNKKTKSSPCGIYFFATKKEILYVGESHERGIALRIQQHFRDKDTGSLRSKLSKTNKPLKKLESSSIYFVTVSSISEIRFIEAYFIGILHPTYNFL